MNYRIFTFFSIYRYYIFYKMIGLFIQLFMLVKDADNVSMSLKSQGLQTRIFNGA